MPDSSIDRSLFFRWGVWIRDHRYLTLVLALAAMGCCVAAYQFVRETLQRRVILLTGPEGSFNNEIGDVLHDRFLQEPAWHLWGQSFDFSVHNTDGSQQNRSRVNDDRQGRLLGIALDGFSDTPNVRTMLHLTDVPLLILANPAFLSAVVDFEAAQAFPENSLEDESAPPTQLVITTTVDTTTETTQPASTTTVATQPATAQPAARQPNTNRLDAQASATSRPASPTFSQIAAYVKRNPNCHFYLGPPGSGTRTLAKQVLNYYDLSPHGVDRLSQLDFIQAAYALADGHVDLAFFLLPAKTDFIVELLRHGEASLVGIDGTGGLVDSIGFLETKSFEAGLFGHDIPPQSISTIQARIVLVCSASMPKYDGYWLTRSIAEFLSQDETVAESLAKDLSPSTQGTSYRMHDGASMFYDQREPWYIIFSRNSIQWLLGVLLVAPLATFLPIYLSQLLRGAVAPASSAQESAPPPAGDAQASRRQGTRPTPAELLERAQALRERCEKLPVHASPAQLAKVRGRVKSLDAKLDAARSTKPADKDLLDQARAALKEAKKALHEFDRLTASAVPAPQDDAL
ncbi:MAG TPA: TAXI family TRAP transporter solute-binding subunit [Pirellulales bacterium]|nr:TAXI family TRAP transporter solute-binding subunit [Pirellulales bacterium]